MTCITGYTALPFSNAVQHYAKAVPHIWENGLKFEHILDVIQINNSIVTIFAQLNLEIDLVVTGKRFHDCHFTLKVAVVEEEFEAKGDMGQRIGGNNWR